MESATYLTPRILLEYFQAFQEEEDEYISLINKSLLGLGLEEISNKDEELPDNIIEAVSLAAAYNVFCLTNNLEPKNPVFRSINDTLMLSWTKTCFADGKSYAMPFQMLFMKTIVSIKNGKTRFFAIEDNLTKELFLNRDFLLTINFIESESKTNQNNQKKLQPVFTYVILDESTGYYKIGRSKEPDVREKTLQAQKPTLSILYKTEKNIEVKLHNYFKSKRIRGEWFKLNEIDLDIIQRFFEDNTYL